MLTIKETTSDIDRDRIQPGKVCGPALELGELPELVFDLTQDRLGQPPQLALEALVVDRAALVDHDLASLPVACDARRE